MIDLAAARTFVAARARLLDRLRFAHLADDGDPTAVVAALEPYANPDGGFGRALEPDLRALCSEPVAVLAAFDVLHEAGAAGSPLALRALDWLTGVTTPDGGVPFVLPGGGTAPHAPWFTPRDDPPPSLHMTSAVAAAAHRLARANPALGEHPWLAGADEFCFARLGAVNPAAGYEVRFVVDFLSVAPDRERADAGLEALRPLVAAGGVPVAGGIEGERQTLLDLAPTPGHAARRFFGAEDVERALDELEARQRDDGGWDFDWLAWDPAVTWEWRGRLTADAVGLLRANGRLR